MPTAGRSARSCQDRSPIPRLSRDIYGSYAVEILVGRQWMSGSRPQEQDSAVRLVFASASSKSGALDQESASALRKRGFEVGDSCIRDRQLLVRVNNVFMFPADAEDLAHDRATLKQTLIETLARSFTIRSDLSNGRYRAVARRGRNE